MSLRAAAPVSRLALNTMARPSGVNEGWLLLPLSFVSFTGVPTLSRLPVQVRSVIHRFSGFWPCAAVMHALAATYPQSVERARVLFEWLGSSQSKWSGFPSYEEVPEHYLMRIPLESLTAALGRDAVSAAQIAGAARFFAGYQFAARRSPELQRLPDELRARLLAEGLRVDDEDRQKRAQHAFAQQSVV